MADHLIKINDERKVTVAHIMKDIKKVLGKRKDDEKPIIVVGNPNWLIGVLGIVASKVVDEYKKPAFIWGGDGNGFIRGSCRSYGGVNLVDLMTLLPENALLEFGGHSGAGGFSVSHEEIHFLEDRLMQVFESIETKEETLLPEVDAIIGIDDVNNENYKIIEKLAPFGMGNPKPLFFFKGISIDTVKEFGKDKNHLELTFKNSRDKNVKAIAFFKTRESYGHILIAGDRIDMVASIEKNNFLGKEEIRLKIFDIILK